MKALINKITPWHPAKVALQWELEATTEEGVYLFDVYRSGSPGGPWTKLTETPLADTYLFEDLLDDEDANTLSLARDIYYRVRAEPPSGAANEIYSVTVNLDGLAASEILNPIPAVGYRVDTDAQYEPNPQTGILSRPGIVGRKRLLRRKIIREEYILLRKLAGIQFWLLKRRHFGTRCVECYDPPTRGVLKSHCTTCYGTSWTGGYFTPIEVYGRRKASQIQSSLSPQTKDDLNFTRIQLLDFPRIDEGDILVEIAHNRRFIVKQRYDTTLKTIMVHQTVAVSELGRQAAEYAIPVTL